MSESISVNPQILLADRPTRFDPLIRHSNAWSTCVLLLCFLAGCSKAAGSANDPPPPKKEKPPAAAFEGRIEGVIRLAEGAKLPTLADPQKTSALAVVDPPAPCSPLNEADRQTLALGAERELANIHVALTQMKHVPPAAPQVRSVFFPDCRARPFLIAAQRGDTLRLINRTQATLLPTLSGETVMQGLMPGQERTIKLEKPGAFAVTCGFGAFCGRSEVIVTTHPLFAVSDAHGHFTIARVPLGEQVVVHAFHPQLGVTKQSVKLTKAKPVATLELVLTPPAR